MKVIFFFFSKGKKEKRRACDEIYFRALRTAKQLFRNILDLKKKKSDYFNLVFKVSSMYPCLITPSPTV